MVYFSRAVYEKYRLRGSVRIHNTNIFSRASYLYTIRTCENTQYVRTFPHKLNYTIHSAHGFPRTNYTIRYLVRTDLPVQITLYDRLYVRISLYELHDTYGFSMFVRERFQFQTLLFVTRNKISLKSVESLNRTFFFSTCSFSVVLGSKQCSKGIVSHHYSLF